MGTRDDLLVVKLGGSSASSPDLARWVAAIGQAKQPTVVVPGGGPFANTVRRYQPKLGFDDRAAHEMAILGMEQFGLALISMEPRMVRAKDRADIETALEAGRIPVWLARDVVLGTSEIAENWNVTSDSLAAWLAHRLAAGDLCLIKQIDVPDGASVDALVGAQIVDEMFAEHLKGASRLHVAGPGDLSKAASRFAEGKIPGHTIAAFEMGLVAAAG
ncbi:amino acid kinase [Jiella sp. MQZ9-1]|uniref:Amino acid kinase n=1 Tax=Jiella flava TaxID=2816857 RepID=A0A939JXB8_9HYPH|nr:amino acid kinase [Jiella flava]MBO0663907.1 amino acid kinase [Jiella flava]MCD2472479.1 amino acid kinase [Jiella flava]